jgi:hypothetical protein
MSSTLSFPLSISLFLYLNVSPYFSACLLSCLSACLSHSSENLWRFVSPESGWWWRAGLARLARLAQDSEIYLLLINEESLKGGCKTLLTYKYVGNLRPAVVAQSMPHLTIDYRI